jgi:hypothetical protein
VPDGLVEPFQEGLDTFAICDVEAMADEKVVGKGDRFGDGGFTTGSNRDFGTALREKICDCESDACGTPGNNDAFI